MRIFAILALYLTTSVAIAQEDQVFFINKALCVPSEEALELLESQYGETPVLLGDSVVSNYNGNNYSGIMILTATPDWSSHTLSISFDDGVTCILAQGTKLIPASSLKGDKI